MGISVEGVGFEKFNYIKRLFRYISIVKYKNSKSIKVFFPAKQDEERELYNLAGNIPFDDRVNYNSEL